MKPCGALLGKTPGASCSCFWAYKKPLTAHGFKDASLDATQLLTWWTENPDGQVGIPTGEASGIFALDLDGEVAVAWAGK